MVSSSVMEGPVGCAAGIVVATSRRFESLLLFNFISDFVYRFGLSSPIFPRVFTVVAFCAAWNGDGVL